MTSTDTTRQARTAATDAAYLASQALADLATVIGRDLLPVPIGIAPPAHGFELEVHVRREDVLAWRRSMVDVGFIRTRRARDSLHHRVTGLLDGPETTLVLWWIEEARS